MQAWGIDSVQAILLALQMIGADIYTSSYHKSGHLMFEEAGQDMAFRCRRVLVSNDRTYGA